jgi:hypothetical protein
MSTTRENLLKGKKKGNEVNRVSISDPAAAAFFVVLSGHNHG